MVYIAYLVCYIREYIGVSACVMHRYPIVTTAKRRLIHRGNSYCYFWKGSVRWKNWTYHETLARSDKDGVTPYTPNTRYILFGVNYRFTTWQLFKTTSWWRHQMETFSALLVLCAVNSPVTGEFPPQRPVIWNFDVFYLRLNKRLGKQSWGWWFETPSCWWWCHCNGDADVVNKYFQNANVSISTRHYGIMDWGSVLEPKCLSCIFLSQWFKNKTWYPCYL